MPLTRREFIKLAGLVSAGAALAACQPLPAALTGRMSPLAGWPAGDDSNFAALNRLTFGPRVEERLLVSEIGLEAWIEEQLASDPSVDVDLALRLAPFKTLGMQATELADWSSRLFGEYDRDTAPNQLRQATLIRQVYSRRQLEELMVEFWSDHFSVSTDKGDVWFLKTVDDREVIRKHALGSFRDLLQASAHSPAMLVYLDNQANRKGAPNENYARELMELHTLGVNGGYTQDDVMELARCLTGWTVKEHFWRGDFTFQPEQHDPGPKRVLGISLPPGGQAEAETVLDALAAHPATACFIAAKLARRFIAESPPADLVDKAAAAFTRGRGDIRGLLRTILLDGALLPGAAPKYKRPLNFITSALRTLNAQTDGGAGLQDYLAKMGQRPFAWPTPDGYPDTAAVWQANLMPRWQFALALAQGEIPGTHIDINGLLSQSKAASPEALIEQFSQLLLGASLPAGLSRGLTADLRAQGGHPIEELAPAVIAGLLASPAFQWR